MNQRMKINVTPCEPMEVHISSCTSGNSTAQPSTAQHGRALSKPRPSGQPADWPTHRRGNTSAERSTVLYCTVLHVTVQCIAVYCIALHCTLRVQQTQEVLAESVEFPPTAGCTEHGNNDRSTTAATAIHNGLNSLHY